MKIIIAGAGEVGTHLARLLSKEKHQITIIDREQKKLDLLTNNADVLGIAKNVVSPSTLKDAGIKDTDLFIAVTAIEETNIISALLAKKLGAKKTIARIDNIEFLKNENEKMFNELGIDSLIYPQLLASEEIADLLKQAGISEKIDFYKDKLSMYVLKLEKNAPILNKSLIDVSKIVGTSEYRAVAIDRKNKTIIPKGTDVFLENDLVYVISNKSGLIKLLELSGKENIVIKNIMILGGSRIARNLAKELQYDYSVKLIEQNFEKCEKLANDLENTLVLNGDGSNAEFLLSEGIKKMDAFIAVTQNAETNILSCLVAKNYGVKKTIAEIENLGLINLAESIGIETIINKKLITASKIYYHTFSAEVTNFKMLTGTHAEVLELIAHKNSKIVGVPLSKIKFPENAIVGGIIRNDDAIIAKGDTIVNPFDKVIVFSLPSSIREVGDLFK